MTKKILFLLAASASMAQADTPEGACSYSGGTEGSSGSYAFFEYGIGGAFGKLRPFGKFKFDMDGLDSQFKKKKNIGGLANRLALGMNYVCSNGFLVGADVGYTFLSKRATWQAESPQIVNVNVKIRCRGYAHVSTRWGVQWDKNAVFARLGVAFPKFNAKKKWVDLTNNEETLRKGKSSKGFFLVGIGYERDITKNFALGLNYTLYTGKVSFYKMIQKDAAPEVVAKRKQFSQRVKISEIMATFKYKVPVSR